jgi:hypothetical protein
MQSFGASILFIVTVSISLALAGRMRRGWSTHWGANGMAWVFLPRNGMWLLPGSFRILVLLWDSLHRSAAGKHRKVSCTYNKSSSSLAEIML